MYMGGYFTNICTRTHSADGAKEDLVSLGPGSAPLSEQMGMNVTYLGILGLYGWLIYWRTTRNSAKIK